MVERLVRQPRDRDNLALALALGISERRLLGWEPAERHEHYAPDGELTGYTVVVREPEWSDDQRYRMLSYRQYDAEVCACGWHNSLTGDKSNYFQPETRVCPVCAGTDRYRRILRDQDKRHHDAMGDLPASASDPSDGRTVYTRMLSPLEVMERRRRHQATARSS